MHTFRHNDNSRYIWLDVFWQSTVHSIPAYIACKLIQDNNKEGTATVTKSVLNAKKKTKTIKYEVI